MNAENRRAAPSNSISGFTPLASSRRWKRWSKTHPDSLLQAGEQARQDLFAFMSLIHTCQLCGANSFDYLIELQRHTRELEANPAAWMPWHYRETIARLEAD